VKRPDNQTRSNRLRNPRPIRVPRPSERNPACRAASRERCGSSNRTSCESEREASVGRRLAQGSLLLFCSPSDHTAFNVGKVFKSIARIGRPTETRLFRVRVDSVPSPTRWIWLGYLRGVGLLGAGRGVDWCQPRHSLVCRSHRQFGDVLTRRPGRCKGVATTGEGLRQLLLRIICLVRPDSDLSVGMRDDPVAVEAWLGTAAASETYARRANGSMAIVV
jgi:hypothetical protein